MNGWILGVDQAASVWWTYTFHATWQGAAVGLLVLAAVYLGKRLPAPLRYWLLLVALAKFLFPPFLSLPIGVFHYAGPVVPATPPAIVIAMPAVPESAIPIESSVALEPSVSFEPSLPLDADVSLVEDSGESLPTVEVQASAPSQSAFVLPGWKTWLLAAHAAGFMLIVCWITVQWLLLVRAIRRAQLVMEGELYERFLSLCGQIGLRRKIRLLISAEQQAPMAFGLFCPTVMVPKSVAEDLAPPQADTILTHELAHHRRGDIWVNWTQLLLIAVWWFNPVVWLLSRALRRTREDCCDDLVLSRKLTTPDAYCETLLRAAAELSAPMPLGAVLGFAERLHPLANRLRRIMDGTLRRTSRLSFVGLLAVVVVAIFLLPGLPSAEREEEKTRAEKATVENEAVGQDVILSSEIVPNSPLRGPSGESIYGLGELRSVAYSPDGKSIATCGGLGAVLWDVETNRPVRAYFGHTEHMYSVRFSPDGTRILTADGDKTVRLWDVKTGAVIRSFGGHEKAITCAVFSPDGRRIVTTGGDGLAKVWDAETGAEICTLSGHKAGVFSVAFSPDGKKVLTGSEDNTAKMWDAETGSEIHTLAGHKLYSHARNVISVAFSPDGTKVLTRGADGTAKIWDAGKGLEIRTFGSDYEEEMRVGFFIEFSPNGKMILSTGSGIRAALWDAESGAQIRKFGNPGSQSNSAVFSPDGTKVLAVNENMDVDLWDVETGGKVQTFTGHTSRVDCASLSPDGTRIVTSSGILWDVRTGKEQMRIFPPERFRGIGGSAAAFSRDGKEVLIGRKSAIWSMAIGEELPGRPSQTFTGNYLGLSPDGMPIITDGHMIELIKETGEMERFSGHTDAVLSAAFSSDGTKMVTGSRDKTARLWDVETGSQIRAFQGHEDSVDAVALSPDGTKVLTGSQDKTARLWDAETGQEIERFERHTRRVSTVAFSPDGTAYLTGSIDGTVMLMRPGREPASFPHGGMVSSVAFTPDGTKILTTSLDGTTRIWDLGDSAQVSAATPEVESATADHSSRTSERGTEKGVAESEAVRSQVTPSSNVAAFSSLRGPSGESIFGLGELLSAAYSPDGKYIATCGGLGAFLWDVESNRLIRAFLGHTKEVYSVDFSPDGTKIVTGSNDKTARIWNTETGDLIRTFAGHTKGVRAAVFSPDGKKVVTGSWDAAKLWDSETGAEIRTFSSPQSGVSDVAFSPDGKKVLAGDTGNAARIWDTETGSEIRTFTGHGDQVRSVAFSPDGTKVLTGSKDGAAKIWDAETGLEIRTFAGHKSDVYSVAMSPDGKKVLTGGRGNIAALWDTESGTQIRTYGEPGSTATSVTFSPDGTRVLAAGGDMNAHVWNTETGEEIQTLTGHTSPLFSTALSPDGTKIVTSSGMLWDLTTGKAVQTFSPRQIAECILAAFLPDGAKVLMGFSDSAVFLDAETGTEIRRFKKITFTENIMALSPDGRRILTGSQWTAKLWDVGTGEEIRTFSGHTAKVWSLAFSPDGTRVLTGARDNTARLWDVETGAQIQAFFGHDGAVRSVALSPDQKRVLTGSEDNTARLWNAETGAQIRTLSGHTGNVSAVAFSPDGTECLTGSWDGTVKLWRRELVKTFVHNGGVSTVTYLPDGTRILTGSRDGTIRIWDLGKSAQVSAATSKETRRTFDSLPDREEGPTATPTEESPTPIPRAETATTAPDLDKRLSGPVTANRTDLSLILILMASEAGLKLTIDPGINPKVTFSLENPTVRQVLETVLPEEGLDYLIMPGGALRIGDVAVIQAEKQSPHVQRTDQAPGLDKRLEGPILATQTDLFQMLTLIAADTGLKLTIDPGINPKVTCLLENPTAREVLDTILPGEGLDYMVMPGGVVRIGIAEVIAPARQNPPERRLDNAPDLDKRIEGPIRANQNPLAQILTIVSGETGFNFSLDRDIEPKVTFCMDSPTVREILEAVLPGQGLDYVVTSSGVVRIGPEKLIARTRTHPPGESRQKAPGLDERIQGPIVASQTDLSQILTLLGNDTGANFTLDSDSNVKVTFAMESPTVRQILDGVLPGQGLDYIVLPSGVIRIGRSSNGSHVELVTETFTARPEHIPVLEKAFDAVKTRNAKIKSEPDLNRITVTDTPEAIDSMRQLTTKIKVEPTTTLRLWVFFIEESADVSLSDLSNALHSVKSKDGLLLGSHPHRMFLVIDHPSVVKKMKNIVFSWEPNITPFYFADRDCPDAITANQVLQSWFSETPTSVPESPVAKPTALPLAENYKIESILGKAAVLIDYTLKPIPVRKGTIVDDPLGKFEVVEIDEGNRRVRVRLLFDGHEKWIGDWTR